MNYIILNEENFLRNQIKFKNIKEVYIDGRERCDVVFARATTEILEKLTTDVGYREIVFREQWLLRDHGVRVVVIEVPQDILYAESAEFIEECFRFFDKKGFYLELGCVNVEDSQSKYRYFIIGLNKDMDFKLFFNEKIVKRPDDEVLPYICKKIEDEIL